MILALALCCAGISRLVRQPAAQSGEPKAEDVVLIDEVITWSPPAMWVDARAARHYDEGHVPDAIPLNEDEWDALLPPVIERWSPGRRIVVYCDSVECDAARSVANRLRSELGISEVFVLKGGWQSWHASQRQLQNP